MLGISSLDEIQAHPWFQLLNTSIKSQIQVTTSKRIGARFHSIYSPLKLENSNIWIQLRNIESKVDSIMHPPFVPNLLHETDHKNFDDFDDPVHIFLNE